MHIQENRLISTICKDYLGNMVLCTKPRVMLATVSVPRFLIELDKNEIAHSQGFSDIHLLICTRFFLIGTNENVCYRQTTPCKSLYKCTSVPICVLCYLIQIPNCCLHLLLRSILVVQQLLHGRKRFISNVILWHSTHMLHTLKNVQDSYNTYN